MLKTPPTRVLVVALRSVSCLRLRDLYLVSDFLLMLRLITARRAVSFFFFFFPENMLQIVFF
jgi:hypothetical protein